MLHLFVCQKKGDVMVMYFVLLEEGGCYGCISNISAAFIKKYTQCIAYSATNKHHAFSPLECTNIVYVSTSTYRLYIDRYRHVDDYSHTAINMHSSIHKCYLQQGKDNQHKILHCWRTLLIAFCSKSSQAYQCIRSVWKVSLTRPVYYTETCLFLSFQHMKVGQMSSNLLFLMVLQWRWIQKIFRNFLMIEVEKNMSGLWQGIRLKLSK